MCSNRTTGDTWSNRTAGDTWLNRTAGETWSNSTAGDTCGHVISTVYSFVFLQKSSIADSLSSAHHQ